jgi:HEAT repeat protein
MPRTSPLVLAAAALARITVIGPAFAETHQTAPAGGGLPALDVKVDVATGAVTANGAKLPITLTSAQLPGERDVVVEPIAIGEDRHIVHVRVPAKGDVVGVAWEAIVAAGRAQPIFAGLTGLTTGDPGERTGKAVQIVANGETSFVLVGGIQEDLRICGQAVTLLEPLALYPSSLELRPATFQRLGAEQQSGSHKIVAVDKGRAAAGGPLAELLVARGSSVPGSRGAELIDRDARTVWSEKRPGIGQGEFVVFAASKDVPIAKMQVVVAPPGASASSGAAPKTFYLATSTQTFEVAMPDDAWLKPGESYEITFPQPIETSCVALVLDSAYARGQAHPEVGIAEVMAYSEFDTAGATLDEVAKKLSSDRGIAAAQLLERAGAGALAAVEKAYDGLDERGRGLAIDVASAHERCDEAAPLLARGLCGKAGQAPRKAHEKLERCAGAASVLAKSVREDAGVRACIAPTLAAIAPQEALDPIADALAATPEAERETRATLRSAMAEALKAVPQGRLAALVGNAERPTSARLEILRAAEARVAEAPAESEATLAELLRGSPPLRSRYLALGPLEELGRMGSRSAVTRIVEMLTRDPDWPVRARAAEAGAELPDAQGALRTAARDPEPRVREAALQALAASPSPPAIETAKALLSEDGWSFVKTQAVGVLGKAPASADVDAALGGALHDRGVGVRGAALVALARHRAGAWHKAIRERLDDKEEDGEVRAAAARALGGVCDVSSVDRLTELVHGLGVPGTSEEEQQVALGALVGLAALHPHDLRDRLTPLLSPSAPPQVRTAAEQALSAHAACP